MQTIEEIILKDGFYMTAAQGVSMLPFIRPKVDTVVIEKVTEDCVPMEIVLYRNPSGQMVLHRIIRAQERHYLICGDNCTFLEHIEKAKVIGKLTKVYHNEKEIKLNFPIYRFYILLWCRPYRIRMMLLRVRNKMRGIVRKIRH
ncbi:MAG: S24/S26 family peptidase [Lachnospiraceae bacterium]|nr:S24/S26 family peptidase [Lachnospiraceae bacterium]